MHSGSFQEQKERRGLISLVHRLKAFLAGTGWWVEQSRPHCSFDQQPFRITLLLTPIIFGVVRTRSSRSTTRLFSLAASKSTDYSTLTDLTHRLNKCTAPSFNSGTLQCLVAHFADSSWAFPWYPMKLPSFD